MMWRYSKNGKACKWTRELPYVRSPLAVAKLAILFLNVTDL